MPRDARAYLADALEAARHIEGDTAGLDADIFEGVVQIRRATERNFEIIGEALRQLSRVDAELFDRIDHAADIIAFRNVIAHRYFDLDPARVHAIVTQQLPILIRQLRDLLEELNRPEQ